MPVNATMPRPHEERVLALLQRSLEERRDLVVEGQQPAVEIGIDAQRRGEQQARHGGLREHALDDAQEVRAHLAHHPRRVGLGNGLDGCDAVGEGVHEGIDELLEDRSFVLEIQVERAAGDLGAGHDVVDAGVVVALLGEHLGGHRKDLFASLCPVHRASGAIATTGRGAAPSLR